MKNIWIWAVVAIVVLGGGYWYWQSQQAPAMQPPAMSDDGTTAAVDKVDDANAKTTGSTQTSGTSGTGTSVNVNVAVNTPKTVTVSFNGDAFNPSTVTINKGDTVKFVATSGEMWVASNAHPNHTGYDGTTRDQHCAAGYSGAAPFDECAPGTSFNFTFTKTGSWGYHDHMNAGLGGTVIVQ